MGHRRELKQLFPRCGRCLVRWGIILILSLVALEVILRISLPSVYTTELFSEWSGDPNLITKFMPTFKEPPRYIVPVRRNATHAHDQVPDSRMFTPRWFTLQPDYGRTRIIGLGDSHMGSGLLPEDCFIGENVSSRLECLNFGVGGYNLEDKGAYLEKEIIAFGPDVIVLQILDDDCDFGPTIWDFGRRDSGFLQWLLPVFETANKAIYRASYAYRIFWVRLMQHKLGSPSPYPLHEQNLTLCAESLRNIVQFMGQENITLVTVLSHAVKYDIKEYPRDNTEKQFFNWFLEMNYTFNLSAVMLIDEFRDIDYTELKTDEAGHYNERGYEIAHRALYSEFVKKGIISDSNPSKTLKGE